MSETPARVVISVAPLDDEGAPTADRYDWQAAMAAADGLRLFWDGLSPNGRLNSECRDWVLCEWQEDWVVISGNKVELVSGKHRDLSMGSYTTVNKLADDGGLAHLFNRWAALKEIPYCRLVTSGGLAGSGEPPRLVAAITALRARRSSLPEMADFTEGEIVGKLRTAIGNYCGETRARWSGEDGARAVPDEVRDIEVARFLAALTIDDGQPQRDHLPYAAPGMFVKPVLEKMAVDGPEAAVWEAVLGLFRQRMRARGRVPGGELPMVLQRGHEVNGLPRELARTLKARTVTMPDIEKAISVGLKMPGAYRSLPVLPPTNPLEAKLHEEGCSANAIERAKSLRAAYLDYWSDRESSEPAARLERLRFERRLQRLSDEVTDAATSRGPALWRRLQTALDETDARELPPGMDADLAMGGICDLADRCMVWFGPRFDVDEVLGRVQSEQGQQP